MRISSSVSMNEENECR